MQKHSNAKILLYLSLFKKDSKIFFLMKYKNNFCFSKQALIKIVWPFVERFLDQDLQ